MNLDEIPRTFRTVHHLRFSQICWRLRYQCERHFVSNPSNWAFSRDSAPPLRSDFSCPNSREVPGENSIEQLARGNFKHLHREKELGRERTDWRLDAQSENRLWTVTLHYHGWLVQLAHSMASQDNGAEQSAQLFQHYVSDWIQRCGVSADGARALAWNSYAVATRVESWIRAYSTIGRSHIAKWGNFETAFLGSLWQQAAFLYDHIEYDLRANHLIRDAVGLALAGRFFDGAKPKHWLETAQRLAIEQSSEQVLADGGHFERSPMYHLEVMRDIHTLATLLENDQARKQLTETWRRMAEFAAWMRHPDGNIPLLNDAAFNGTLTPTEALGLSKGLDVNCNSALRTGGKHFTNTGLVIWHGEPWSIFFDVGPLGPDYQPGHGHADTLTIECSYKGARLFVDPGTHSYDLDDRRRYNRSTAAHNTVCIDGENSSEVWHIFRVGRRAYPLDVYADFVGGGVNASAEHTGYVHLSGRPSHSRRVEFNAGKPLTISDRIAGTGRHKLEGGWLLHPDWSATASANGWELNRAAGKVRVTVEGPPALRLFMEQRPYHPEFGLEIKTTRLCWRLDDATLPVAITTRIE